MRRGRSRYEALETGKSLTAQPDDGKPCVLFPGHLDFILSTRGNDPRGKTGVK